VKASIDAVPKEPAAVYLAAFGMLCQWQNARFHRFFAVFPGISLEKPAIWLEFALECAPEPLATRV
jgi:drug/metabolite transporter superfamily protein YnfA